MTANDEKESRFEEQVISKKSTSEHCFSENGNVNVLDIQSSQGSWIYNANLSSGCSPELKARFASKNIIKNQDTRNHDTHLASDFLTKPSEYEKQQFDGLESIQDDKNHFDELASIQESSKRDFDHIQSLHEEDPTLQSCQQSLQFEEEISDGQKSPIQSPTSPTSRMSYLSYTNTGAPIQIQQTSASPNKRYLSNSTNVIDFDNLPDL